MLIGDQFKYIHHTAEIRSVGKISLVIGRGVGVVLDYADRGPAMEMFGMARGRDALSYYGAGPLVDAAMMMFDQGVNAVYGFRVMGLGYATADVDVFDSNNVKAGTFVAPSAGTHGNVPVIKVEDSLVTAWNKERFNGDGTAGPYALKVDDIDENNANYVTVAGVARTIVYAEQNLGENNAYINKATGGVLFHSSNKPGKTNEIIVGVKHKTRRVVMTDGLNPPEVISNVQSVLQLAAKTRYSAIANYVPAIGSTHLPKPVITQMEGGDDGAEPNGDDWELAFESALKLPGGVIPTSVTTSQFELTPGGDELFPMMDGYLSKMADQWTPTLGYMSANPYATKDEILELATGYNSMWLTIIGNGWHRDGRSLAPARAGMEAAVELGSSTSEEINVLKGIGNNLLYQFSDTDREELTANGIDVLEKEAGIKPYAAITTNRDENFKQCVDMRTINWNQILLNSIVKRMYHARRTKENMGRVKSTMELLLEEQCKHSILDDYSIAVLPNSVNRNKVDIDFWLQCVGHMQSFHTVMSVGYWSSNVAE